MSMLRRSLHIASKQLFYLLVISLLILLILLAGAVWLSDNVAKRKDEIAAWTSQQIGLPVQIGSVSLYWLELVPKLEVNDVKVFQHDKHTPIAAFKHLYAGLDLISSFQQQKPVIDETSINGVSLYVVRNQQGEYDIVRAIQKQSAQPADSNWAAWLTMLQDIELHSVDVIIDDQKQAKFSGVYSIKQANLHYADNQWQGNASVKLPQQLGGTLKLSADAVMTRPGKINDWHLDLSSNNIQLQPLLAGMQWHGITLSGGEAQAQVSIDQHPVSGQVVKAQFKLNDLDLASLSDDKQHPVSVQKLAGLMTWRHQDDQWQLDVEKLDVISERSAWPQSHISVTRSENGDISVDSGYIRLSDVTAVAMLMQDTPAFINQPKPAGDLNALKADYKNGEGLKSLTLDAKDVASLPWQDYPGVTGLSISLDWQGGKGTATLDSHKLTLYPEGWLDDAVYLDSVTGTINWQQQNDGWQFSSHNLRLWNDDFNLTLDGSVEDKNGKQDSDLTLKMQDVNVKNWKAYVPKRILDKDFWAWAQNAFVSGQITDGQIDFKGDPRAFPFDLEPDKGDFDMKLNVKGAQLHYGPGWPDLINVNGTITGKGNDLLIKSQSGTIAGMQFKDVTTKIVNLVREKPVLTVDGQVVGTTQQALAFLQNSPLKKRFGKIADWLTATGQSDVDLKLNIPLTHVDDTYASGQVSFDNSTLHSAAVPQISLQNVQGKLAFSNDGVQAKDIKAISFDKPVSIDVMPRGQSTLVNFNGEAEVATLRKLWPEQFPNFVSGKLNYQTQLSVDEKKPGEFELGVAVKSDLQGVDIAMPAPLGKTSQQARSSSWSMNESGHDLLYHFQYGDDLKGVISPGSHGLRGEVSLGSDQPTLPKTGLRVKAHLHTFAVNDWRDWLQQQKGQQGELANSLDNISVQLDETQLYGQPIRNLMFTAQRATDAWHVQLASDITKGTVDYPVSEQSSQPIKIRLDYAKLHIDQDANDKPETGSVSSEPEQLWPSLDLQISKLNVNDMQLGQLDLEAQKSSDKWTLRTATLKSDVLDASASGNWMQQGSNNTSQINVSVRSNDLKSLLARLGYQQAIKAENTRLNMKLHWPDSPLNFSRQTIAGDISIKTGHGELLNVEPGAAGRIFGLLSFTAIPRRLALDFSDLFGKGFGFGSIKGNFKLADGKAHTDDLLMEGDSANILVTGSADLVNKTYDQKIKVTPNVSSTLPLAGAVAGGPVGLGVGTAIMLFDKIAGKIFDKDLVNVISYSYDLTGPWSDPQMTIVKPANQ